MQAEGLKTEGRHHLLLLYKQAHDQRGIAESLHVVLDRASLTAYEVDIFSIEISQNMPTLSLRNHLSSSAMGEFSRDYAISLPTESLVWQWKHFSTSLETQPASHMA